jgi:hypothetical protein
VFLAVSMAILVTGCTSGVWFHPGKPTVEVRASGHCPTSRGSGVDVKAQADEVNTLLPTTSAPSSALICFYGSQPDSAVAATGRKLAGEIRLDQVDASRLAVSVNKISIAAPPAGAVNCPMDTGGVTIIAFAYPASIDVDLWWKSDGCQLIDNGRIGASQLASPSFAAFQQVFKSITAG